MIKLLELFGGIGACSLAFERLGIPYEIADYVEIDKYAVASYNAIHNTNFEPQDITKWDKDIDVDFIMHGSPCQDFSLAGLQAGADINNIGATRSSLMYETIRIVQKLKPKYVLWENVKNLLSAKHRQNFDNYLNIMRELGYVNHYKVINAKTQGIPQNRERVFTLSIRNDLNTEYQFPADTPLDLKLKDMLEDNVDEKYFLSDKMIKYISATGTENFKNQDSKINLDIARPLTTDQGKRAGCTNYLCNDLPDNYDLNNDGCIQSGKLNHYAYETTDRVYSPSGTSPTVRARSQGDTCFIDENDTILNSIPIKNATKQVSLLAEDGDGIDCSSRMETHRGTVQKGMAQTLDCQNTKGVVVTVPLKRGYDVEIKTEQPETNEIDILGNYSKSEYQATPVVNVNGVAPTVRENHGQVTDIAVTCDDLLESLLSYE